MLEDKPYISSDKKITIEKNKENSTNDSSIVYKIIAEINDYKYEGTTSNHLKRNGYGLNKFSTGDLYLGNWKEDEKDGYGLLITHKDNKNLEIFLGNWKAGKKKYGFYLWGTKEGSVIDEKSYDCFFGNFEDDKYKYGLYCTSSGEKISYYIGNFEKSHERTSDINKSDLNGFFYSEQENKIFQGNFENDHLKEGNIYFLTENKAARCKFNQHGDIQESELLKMESQDIKIAFNEAITKNNRLKDINFKAIISDLNKYLNDVSLNSCLNKLEEKLEKLIPEANK